VPPIAKALTLKPTLADCAHRYVLRIEYDGGLFSGWQRQRGPASVQETLEQALLAMTGEKVTCAAAGRTDRGVHACGQVVHFDLSRLWQAQVLRRGLNHWLLSQGISIVDATQAPPDFHARFCATWRSYTYTLINRPSPSALWGKRAFWITSPLDLALMEKAASFLVGTHDFSSFRHRDCQAQSPIKTLDLCRIERAHDWTAHPAGCDPHAFIHIHFRARSFLHRQVRMMVGALVFVGQGRWSVDHFCRVLDQRKTLPSATTAPPQGLCLTGVGYEDDPFQANKGYA
jgi:tRNA pseudouridine38-40 synthase